MLELDHIYCFCDPLLPEVQVAEANGFTVFPGRKHQGQGTANQCLIFQDNYLEFIYLTSKEEAENNPLQLYRRAQWQKTGANPFGIALRGQIPDEYKKDFWEYKPSYLLGGVAGRSILVHKFNESHPKMPQLFVMALPAEQSINSIKLQNSLGFDKKLIEHKNGVKNISNIEIHTPLDLPVPFKMPNIQVVRSSELKMKLHFKPNIKVKFNSLIYS